MRARWKVNFALGRVVDYLWEYLFIRPLVALANYRSKKNGMNVHYRIYREKYGDHRPDEDFI